MPKNQNNSESSTSNYEQNSTSKINLNNTESSNQNVSVVLNSANQNCQENNLNQINLVNTYMMNENKNLNSKIQKLKNNKKNLKQENEDLKNKIIKLKKEKQILLKFVKLNPIYQNAKEIMNIFKEEKQILHEQNFEPMSPLSSNSNISQCSLTSNTFINKIIPFINTLSDDNCFLSSDSSTTSSTSYVQQDTSQQDTRTVTILK